MRCFFSAFKCITMVCWYAHKMLFGQDGCMFIYRHYLTSWSFYSIDCSYCHFLGAVVTVSGDSLSSGLFDLFLSLYGSDRAIFYLFILIYGEQSSYNVAAAYMAIKPLSCPNFKEILWHVGVSEQVRHACSCCILCVSVCACLASIEVVYLWKGVQPCVLMNMWVSFHPLSSWAGQKLWPSFRAESQWRRKAD